MIHSSRASMLALVALIAGCGDDWSDPPGLGPAPLYPIPGCEDLDHRPCSWMGVSCRERLMDLAACARGDETSAPPPVSQMTEEQFVDYLNQLLQIEGEPPVPNHYEEALVMLGLTPASSLSGPTLVEEEAKFVAGIYRWETKDIVLIKHRLVDDDPAQDSVVLFHELIHALQDRDVDLRAFSEEHSTSRDSALAVDSLVEGEASFQTTRYLAVLAGLDPASVDWKKRLQEAIDLNLASLSEAPSLYLAAYRTFPYDWGARYAQLIYGAGGPDALLAQYASPVLTSRAIMASVDQPLEDLPKPDIPRPTLPDGWELYTETTLGALAAYLAASTVTDSDSALAAALAWRNDRLFIYQPAPDSLSAGTALSWRIELDTDADAARLTQVLSSTLPARQLGTRITIAICDQCDTEWGFEP